MKPLKSTGISLTFSKGHGWMATVAFSTMEHANPEAIEGSIGPRYFGEIGVVIDLAKHAADVIGVSFEDPCIYIDEDGEDWPGDWREQVTQQSDRLGWRPIAKDHPRSVDAMVTTAERAQ